MIGGNEMIRRNEVKRRNEMKGIIIWKREMI